jgi:hypothetical protein
MEFLRPTAGETVPGRQRGWSCKTALVVYQGSCHVLLEYLAEACRAALDGHPAPSLLPAMSTP